MGPSFLYINLTQFKDFEFLVICNRDFLESCDRIFYQKNVRATQRTGTKYLFQFQIVKCKKQVSKINNFGYKLKFSRAKQYVSS